MSQQGTARSYADAQTRTIAAAGATFAYRELGPQSGVPLVLLTHLGANLDGWDPRIVDGLAQDHRVIAVDYRGVGQSTGRVRESFEEMADDVVALIRALGHDRVDMFGLAVGGRGAQAVAAGTAADRPAHPRQRRTGRRAGPGRLDRHRDHHGAPLRAALTLNDPKTPLFFTSTATGRRGRTRVPRSAEGTHDRARQARHPRDVSRAVDCGAPLGAAGSRRMVVGRRPGAHRPRRQRPVGAARERHRAGPASSRRDGDGLPGLRARRRLPVPPRVRRRRARLSATASSRRGTHPSSEQANRTTSDQEGKSPCERLS